MKKVMNKEMIVEGGELVREIRKEVIMVGSDKGFELLRNNSDHVFRDGTFRHSPKHFKQMLPFI